MTSLVFNAIIAQWFSQHLDSLLPGHGDRLLEVKQEDIHKPPSHTWYHVSYSKVEDRGKKW